MDDAQQQHRAVGLSDAPRLAHEGSSDPTGARSTDGGSLVVESGFAPEVLAEWHAFLELFVTVDANWQHDPAAVERLGY